MLRFDILIGKRALTVLFSKYKVRRQGKRICICLTQIIDELYQTEEYNRFLCAFLL